jgi:hypothetical protein
MKVSGQQKCSLLQELYNKMASGLYSSQMMSSGTEMIKHHVNLADGCSHGKVAMQSLGS